MQDGGKGKGGEKKKKDPGEKRRVEAASLQTKFGDLFSVAPCPAAAASTLGPPASKGAGGGGRPRSRSRKNSGSSNKQQQPSGDEASAIVEEWTLRLLAGVGTYTLPPSLPPSLRAQC